MINNDDAVRIFRGTKPMPRCPGERATTVRQAAQRMGSHRPVAWHIAFHLLHAEMALPFVALALFAFGRQVAGLLYIFGLNPDRVVSFLFLQSQYDFFVSRGFSKNLHLYDFHVFELLGWVAIFIVGARLITALLLVEYLDERVEVRGLIPSLTLFILGWLIIGPLGLWVSTNVSYGYSSTLMRFLMANSPGTFLCLQAFVFCCASGAFCEGLCFMLHISVATWRRGKGQALSEVPTAGLYDRWGQVPLVSQNCVSSWLARRDLLVALSRPCAGGCSMPAVVTKAASNRHREHMPVPRIRTIRLTE